MKRLRKRQCNVWSRWRVTVLHIHLVDKHPYWQYCCFCCPCRIPSSKSIMGTGQVLFCPGQYSLSPLKFEVFWVHTCDCEMLPGSISYPRHCFGLQKYAFCVIFGLLRVNFVSLDDYLTWYIERLRIGSCYKVVWHLFEFVKQNILSYHQHYCYRHQNWNILALHCTVVDPLCSNCNKNRWARRLWLEALHENHCSHKSMH